MDRSLDAENPAYGNETSALLGNGLSQNGINYAHDRHFPTTSQFAEDPDTYKSRWKSIRVMYFTQFLAAVTFSITLSSLWPFLKVLNQSATASFLGWVVASYSLGQLIASPLFGAWSNLRKSTREPLAVSLTLGVIANTFYMYLQSIPASPQVFMILSRGFIGVSAGNVAVLRSYISSATTLTERTGCMANVSMCQVIGFIMGPVIQAAVVPIKYPGPVEQPEFHFNMYTAPGFLSAIALLVNLILLILFFREHHIPDEGLLNINNIQSDDESGLDKEMNSIANLKPPDKDAKPDYFAVFSTIYLFFVTLFMFTMLETISTPVTMHMYAWGKSQATFYQGFILGGGGILSFVVFIVIRPLVKRFGDRKMLLAGFVFCFVGYFVFVSWGDILPPRPFKRINNDASHNLSTTIAPNQSAMHIPEDFLKSDNPFATHKAQDSDIPIKSKPDVISFHIPRSVKKQTVSHLRHSDPANHESSDNPNATLTFHKRKSANNLGDGLSLSGNEPNVNQMRMSLDNGKDVISSLGSEVTRSSIDFLDTSKVTPRHIVTHPSNHSSNTTLEPKGCPWTYGWCSYTPYIPLAQYLCATALASIGYPLCQVFSYVIYSKILGPAPQGIWMGWLTAAGSLARTLGPIYISNMYDSFGPRVTYGSVAGLIFVTIIFNLAIYRRLVPFSAKEKPDDLLKFKREEHQNST